ncbi:hypothetical protein ACFOWU_15485 [Epilithonimonas zeae]|uniref:Uncharacterized protein n=1 Tax=Epilithonimonas zeae TaxID=1416779 RepID=A0A1N6IFI6_9FLAO|nr:hypothetical protein [Epilithonimonas zeae]SIO30751.1 hypothetical protein SAMN05444409_2609 [Epilithonimonas zeae]
MKFNFISEKNGVFYNLIAEYNYDFNEDYESNVYVFKIYEIERGNEDYFSLILKEMDNSDLKVVDLYPDSKNYYLGKGISINILLKLKELLKKRIISSSNIHKTELCEFNSPEAIEKIWDRLVSGGFAKYSLTDGFYYLI